MEFKAEDYTNEVIDGLEKVVKEWLEEASAELESRASNNTRRNTGETADKWTHIVDNKELKAYVGNPLQNAIWEEFGTGEYALENNGRKGGWTYYDEQKGEYRHTYGKTPTRALHRAYTSLEGLMQKALTEKLKGLE